MLEDARLLYIEVSKEMKRTNIFNRRKVRRIEAKHIALGQELQRLDNLQRLNSYKKR